jgi:capsular polysaccharide biosynthesis protein
MEYTYRDALEFPVITDLASEDDASASVFIEPPGVERHFERPVPEFVADPDSVGFLAGLVPALFSSPPAFVAKARSARVVGFRTVLLSDGGFFNDDSIRDEKERQDFLSTLSMPDPLNEETGLRRIEGTDVFALDLGGRPIQRVPGTTVLLSSAEPSNYGSWLFRVLPKLQTLKRFTLEENIKFLVWAGTPTFREYLRFLGIPEHRLIQHDPGHVVYELEKAIVPSIRNNQAFLDAESLAFYSRIREQFGSLQQPGNRIYVSRLAQSRGGSPRAMQNEADLIERLRALGFRIVSPETLTVPEQIRTFSSAELVVGPSGSGMFNVVFCHPGTKVIDIESEPHWLHAHLCLFASCGLRFGIFVGKAANQNFSFHHQPWHVNIDALIEQVSAFSLA